MKKRRNGQDKRKNGKEKTVEKCRNSARFDKTAKRRVKEFLQKY
jgi:hypothetical protein